ncbi:aminotransferase class I/II-fold pyridoxal phosphate-dependent enzyme [Alphaproteobacteria bacterium]|nr:aminotransferase class I/II-fold pyridoxal phosphate-dependent enzyme [Alphaproteobacteria bacterium]
MAIVRPEITDLELSGITRIALEGFDIPDVVPLWFGESDLETPDFVCQATKDALDGGKTKYGFARGHQPLRASLKTYLDGLYKTDIDPDRITVPGSTMLSVFMSFMALLEKGDEIIMISPFWPNALDAVKMIGATTTDVRLEERDGRWHLNLEKVKAAIGSKTKAIYVNTPSNPTGWVMSSEEQKSLLTLARERGLGIVSDEVYHRNLYDGSAVAPSFLEIAKDDDAVFVVNGFSKAWAMTGWRLGWVITPAGLADQMAVYSECMNTGATAFIQYGGIAALEQGEDFLADFNNRCKQNREMVMEIIGKHPRVHLLEPQGAFYAFPKIEMNGTGLDLARGILRSEHVGVAAGYTFGPENDNHVRLCYAISPERLEPALKKIASYLDRNDI